MREEVLLRWKLIHARDLALSQAKSLADEARKAGESLQAVPPTGRTTALRAAAAGSVG